MISAQLKRLAKHSAIYGLGGLISRILAVLLLPLYTSYLTTADYGKIETLVAGSTVLTILLRAGISSAFFRFYFDANDDAGRLRVLRTSFWFTMASATVGLAVGVALAGPISEALFGTSASANLVRAASIGLWAQINYDQLASLFRVEERSVAFVVASVFNIFITVSATVLLVAVFDTGPLGVLVGNFTGTLIVYLALIGYRREQLGLELDRKLLREMNRFGLPLIPSALALWVSNFSDRFFLVKMTSASEVGRYSLGVRIASAMVLVLAAFRTAWPAFAYSIPDDRQARRTYAFVLTYIVLATSWVALALTLLSPWLVRLLAPSNPGFWPASRVVGLLAFATVAFGAYMVVVIGIGRVRKTRSNWIITGAAALVNVVLNLILIPRHGMIGAGIATVAAYSVLFVGMAFKAQRVYYVSYQWRRAALAAGAAVALSVIGKTLKVPLPGAIALTVVYPAVLLVLGFYLPVELQRLRSLGSRVYTAFR